MKVNYLLVLIIVVLLVGFNVYIYRQSETGHIIRNRILQLYERDSVKTSGYKIEREIRSYELENNGKRLSPLLEVFDTDGNKRLLSQIIGSDKLILRYSELNCNTCVNKQLDILNSYVDSIGIDNIVLLTNYDNHIYMKQFKKVAGIKFSIFNVGTELNELIPDIERPYFFIIETNMRINNMYVPQIDEKKVTESYIHRIKKYYFVD